MLLHCLSWTKSLLFSWTIVMLLYCWFSSHTEILWNSRWSLRICDLNVFLLMPHMNHWILVKLAIVNMEWSQTSDKLSMHLILLGLDLKFHTMFASNPNMALCFEASSFEQISLFSLMLDMICCFGWSLSNFFFASFWFQVTSHLLLNLSLQVTHSLILLTMFFYGRICVNLCYIYI